MQISDSKQTLIKSNIGGINYSMCCLDKPIDPINSSFFIKIDKNPSKRGIWLGVCTHKVVRLNNYSNCNGYKKGTYAIDQNSYHSQT